MTMKLIIFWNILIIIIAVFVSYINFIKKKSKMFNKEINLLTSYIKLEWRISKQIKFIKSIIHSIVYIFQKYNIQNKIIIYNIKFIIYFGIFILLNVLWIFMQILFFLNLHFYNLFSSILFFIYFQLKTNRDPKTRTNFPL